jgi:nicotinamide riboside kinase
MASKYATQVMREYGREYWQIHNINGRLDPSQLCDIACGHLEREERLIYDSDRYLFVDTNVITTYMFAMHYHGSAKQLLIEMAQRAETRYDLTFVCGDDIPYHDDGTREGDEHRHQFQKMIIDDLNRRGIKYTILNGSLEARAAQIDEALLKL